jgi:rubrerythrin
MESQHTNGTNFTGIKLSPSNKKKMLFAVESHPADIKGDQFILEKERIQMIKEAESIGSVTFTSNQKSTSNKLVLDAELLIDKLGERLAYERAGVRFYEAALAKADAFKRKDLSEELIHIKDEEAEHMSIIKNAIETLGADPTEMTPCADISGVLGQGFMQVLTDPRTSIPQMLNTLVSIELTDNAAWELLINIALKSGQEKIAKNFQSALVQEEEHLRTIKSLLEKELQLNKK